LEALLSLKLPYNLVKLYGPHLTCRFYLLLCKTYTQIATCLPCMPDLEKFEFAYLTKQNYIYFLIIIFCFKRKSVLSSFHRTYSLLNPGSISAAKLAYSSGLNSGKKHSSGYWFLTFRFRLKILIWIVLNLRQIIYNYDW